MKKLISLFMAAVMLFGIGAEAFAAYEGDKVHTYESADCTIVYNITNEWTGNQQVSVSITNNSEETLRNWAIKFDNTGTISNIWNASVLENDGELCVIRNNGYNYELIPDATVEFGFMQQGENLSLPENITLCSKTEDSTASTEISYEIQNNWGEGFIAAVTIKNITNEPLEAWKLHFNGNFEISSIWNANLLYTEDDSFKVENDITTTPIAECETKTFSFEGKITLGEEPVISDFMLTSIVIDMEAGSEDSDSDETGETSETGESSESGDTEETDEPDTPDEPVEPEEAMILCFGEYIAEENALEVYWYSTVEGAVSVYENTNNNGWVKIADVTDEDSYKYEISEDFLVKYIKVKQETENGTIESEPFIVTYSEDGYVCTWLDTDEDGLPDYAEKIYGTDPENPDTDSDGLSDYDEVYTVGTSPLKYDTDEDGMNDADSDLDSDGLSNKEELELGTSPSSADTDGDGLSDYAEIKQYNTDPLKADTDGDTLSDSDNIAIGLDPNDPETFGVPDAEYKVEQTIPADSEAMSRVNTEEAPYELSLEISASGNAAKHLIAGGSIYSNITESDARLGGAVGLNYFGGEVDKVKLIYEINDEYISNDGSEYAENCLDLQGIKRYNIFRYFEDLNMLLPIVTEFDEESNTLYAETDRLGTYCVLDMEVLMRSLGIAPDGASVESISRQMYSVAPVAEKDDLDAEKYCVTFIFDIRKEIVSSEQLDTFKEYVGSFANEVFAENRNITIRLMTQDVTNFYTDSYKVVGECADIDEFNNIISRIKISDKEGFFGNICTVTDALSYVFEHSDSSVKNYVFDIFAQTEAIFEQETAEKLLENSESLVNISMISDFSQTITGFQSEVALATSGININSTKAFDDRIYNHIFNDSISEPMSAILITGYQEVELKGRLNRYNEIDTDYEECADGEDDLHKNDHLTDWDEVGVDHWFQEGLMSYDDEGNAVLPTIMDCLNFTELTYVEEGLKRFEQELGANFGAAICGKGVLPILSDPTRADSDGDGIVDKYDPHKLIAIDVDTPCLYDKGGEPGVENHDMVVNFMNDCKTYICTNPNCGFEVANPDIEDYTHLTKTDFVMVRTLLSLYDSFCEIHEWGMADVVYSLVDKIREEYTLKQHHYSYSNAQGNYVSPCPKRTSSDEISKFYVEAAITDYTGRAELKNIVEYIRSISIYVWKDVGDVAALFLPTPISAAWAFYSEGMVNIFEHINNYWVSDNLTSFMINDLLSTWASYFDAGMGLPVISAILTTRSILSHVGIYITNAYDMLNFDDGYTNDYKVRITFKMSGMEDSIDYFYNLNDILVNQNLNISSDGLCTTSHSQTIYKNAFAYFRDGEKNNFPLAIIGSYYHKQDNSKDGFPWESYYEKTNIPINCS